MLIDYAHSDGSGRYAQSAVIDGNFKVCVVLDRNFDRIFAYAVAERVFRRKRDVENVPERLARHRVCGLVKRKRFAVNGSLIACRKRYGSLVHSHYKRRVHAFVVFFFYAEANCMFACIDKRRCGCAPGFAVNGIFCFKARCNVNRCAVRCAVVVARRICRQFVFDLRFGYGERTGESNFVVVAFHVVAVCVRQSVFDRYSVFVVNADIASRRCQRKREFVSVNESACNDFVVSFCNRLAVVRLRFGCRIYGEVSLCHGESRADSAPSSRRADDFVIVCNKSLCRYHIIADGRSCGIFRIESEIAFVHRSFVIARDEAFVSDFRVYERIAVHNRKVVNRCNERCFFDVESRVARNGSFVFVSVAGCNRIHIVDVTAGGGRGHGYRFAFADLFV